MLAEGSGCPLTLLRTALQLSAEQDRDHLNDMANTAQYYERLNRCI